MEIVTIVFIRSVSKKTFLLNQVCYSAFIKVASPEF